MRRSRVSRRSSKRMFRKSGSRTHRKNFMTPIMRGGYRL